MSIKRFGTRTTIEGDTIIQLEEWADTVSVVMATNASGTSFVDVMEIDAYGNVKVAGRMTQQAEIQ